MNNYTLSFRETDKAKLQLVGGKGANLGELSKISGIRVPEGFCVTTEAYKKIILDLPEFQACLEELAGIAADETEKIREVSKKMRSMLESASIPDDIKKEIADRVSQLGVENAYAIRSSATAEDLPTASFAGQQDTYLNVIGMDAILKNIRCCWGSLFTERAVVYRKQNGFDHTKVYLSVVVQKMVFPEAAGIMFTADPITGNRKTVSVDAGFGMGEALVSGLVTADNYKMHAGVITDKKISAKKLAIYALKEGGTEEKAVEPGRQNKQALTDDQILRLERAGRGIEAYFGCPQDIEWCLYEDTFFFVQSRPITTLYPLPKVSDDKNHLYMSFSHQQMMTDVMRPLGLSMFALLGDNDQIISVGGRMYGDLSADAASPVGKAIVLKTIGLADPLMLSAFEKVFKRKDFMRNLSRNGKKFFSLGSGYFSLELFRQIIKISRDNDGSIVPALMRRFGQSTADFAEKIKQYSGDGLFGYIIDYQKELRRDMYDPQSMAAIFAGTMAASWLNKRARKWFGEKNVCDSLTQSAKYNITAQMGLDLLDVADVVRKYPDMVAALTNAKDENFYDGLNGETAEAIRGYLTKYGMRCTGEIDITRSRFNEQPTTLAPLILNNVRGCAEGERRVRVEKGLKTAHEKENEILAKLHGRRAKQARKKISVLRNFTGYREYPKYLMISRYWVIKQALLREAEKLVQNNVIEQKEDVYYLSFEEFREAALTNRLDYGVIRARRAEYEMYKKLTPPRALTSDGEAVAGEYGNTVPVGALAGIPVSGGTAEGRARVILSMEDARMEEGDILVTAFTDPSWTPVFVSIKGLVTEVGGMLTHGSVIAREYGLPAVVGVENATRLIRDGQRVRINGSDGYVELL